MPTIDDIVASSTPASPLSSANCSLLAGHWAGLLPEDARRAKPFPLRISIRDGVILIGGRSHKPNTVTQYGRLKIAVDAAQLDSRRVFVRERSEYQVDDEAADLYRDGAMPGQFLLFGARLDDGRLWAKVVHITTKPDGAADRLSFTGICLPVTRAGARPS